MTFLRAALVVACLPAGWLVPTASSEPVDSLHPTGVRLLPGSVLVPALLAHPQEARIGVRKEAGSSRLKLDIGASMDLVSFTVDSSGPTLAAGIDFFTYALTTSNEGLRLQVDAVDGFFGGHFSFSLPCRHTSWDLRLRLLHLSAHFVDGHYDIGKEAWRNNRSPLPFTRDFGELVGCFRTTLGMFPLRLYTGFSYATLIRPPEIGRFTTLYGIELSSEDILPELLGAKSSLYFAFHLTLSGTPSYAGTTTVEAGIKLGATYGRGVRIYGSLSSGPDIFSQYYDVRRTVWGMGFAFDAW